MRCLCAEEILSNVVDEWFASRRPCGARSHARRARAAHRTLLVLLASSVKVGETPTTGRVAAAPLWCLPPVLTTHSSLHKAFGPFVQFQCFLKCMQCSWSFDAELKVRILKYYFRASAKNLFDWLKVFIWGFSELTDWSTRLWHCTFSLKAFIIKSQPCRQVRFGPSEVLMLFENVSSMKKINKIKSQCNSQLNLMIMYLIINRKV